MKKLYCKTRQVNIWVLENNSSAINIAEIYDLARLYSEVNKIQLSTVLLNQIKDFKVIFSNEKQLPEINSKQKDNAFKILYNL